MIHGSSSESLINLRTLRSLLHSARGIVRPRRWRSPLAPSPDEWPRKGGGKGEGGGGNRWEGELKKERLVLLVQSVHGFFLHQCQCGPRATGDLRSATSTGGSEADSLFWW